MHKKNKRPHVSDALKSEVWKRDCGNIFCCKCPIPWCTAQIEYTNCVLAHNTPFVKGGATTLDNLRVTCTRCNLGMGSAYTVDEWSLRGGATVVLPPPPKSSCWCW
jgi:5-methylcytosine-specific restriction endonuclease McrA